MRRGPGADARARVRAAGARPQVVDPPAIETGAECIGVAQLERRARRRGLRPRPISAGASACSRATDARSRPNTASISSTRRADLRRRSTCRRRSLPDPERAGRSRSRRAPRSGTPNEPPRRRRRPDGEPREIAHALAQGSSPSAALAPRSEGEMQPARVMRSSALYRYASGSMPSAASSSLGRFRADLHLTRPRAGAAHGPTCRRPDPERASDCAISSSWCGGRFVDAAVETKRSPSTACSSPNTPVPPAVALAQATATQRHASGLGAPSRREVDGSRFAGRLGAHALLERLPHVARAPP